MSGPLHRVIVWGPGQAGAPAIRGIVEHPELQLVGVRAYSADKDGRDAGELCGLGELGIRATRDADALLALDADVVSYTPREFSAEGDIRLQEIVEEIGRILESGKNVITPLTPFIRLPNLFIDQAATDRLQAACETGQTTLCSTGIAPGFMDDYLVLALTSMSRKVETVYVSEILDLSSYESFYLGALGFGLGPEEFEKHSQPMFLEYLWGGAIELVAEALKLKIDELQPTFETSLAEFAFDTVGMHIEVGTVAAVHMSLQGIVDGKWRISVGGYYRMRPDIAPDWPQPPMQGGYRIRIRGVPNMVAEVGLGSLETTGMNDGYLATAMRLVNSIPAVCAASPGISTSLDTPLVVGRG